MRVITSGFFRKPQFYAKVLVFINIFLTNLTLDQGVYINDVKINIKQYFVGLFMIFFKGFVNDNIDYDDKF